MNKNRADVLHDSVDYPEGKEQLRDLGINRKILLKFTFDKYDVRMPIKVI
jgi:hypothetical protein